MTGANTELWNVISGTVYHNFACYMDYSKLRIPESWTEKAIKTDTSGYFVILKYCIRTCSDASKQKEHGLAPA